MYSFQLAKFLSQLIASRRRKTPLHLDREERKKKKTEMAGGKAALYRESGRPVHGPLWQIT